MGIYIFFSFQPISSQNYILNSTTAFHAQFTVKLLGTGVKKLGKSGHHPQDFLGLKGCNGRR